MKKTLVLLLVLAQTAFAEPPTPNEQARFLAGMPQEGSSLAGLAQHGDFNSHAKDLDATWADAEQRQLNPIREWVPLGLPEAVSDTSPLLYVFSGPDFLHAYTFFPNASTYVLAAVEPVGLPPDVTKLSEGELGSSLRNLRNTLNASLSFSFFITAALALGLKAIIIPVALRRMVDRLGLTRGVEKVVGVGSTLMMGLALTALALLLVLRVTASAESFTREGLALALAIVLLGLLMMITRRSVVTQIVGFMSLENGLILAATGARGMPLVVEISVAFSVLIALLVFGVFVFDIHDRFEGVGVEAIERMRGDRE